MKKNQIMKVLAYTSFVMSTLLIVAATTWATFVPLVAPSLFSVPFFALASVAFLLGVLGMRSAFQMLKRAKSPSGSSRYFAPLVAPAPVAPVVAPEPVVTPTSTFPLFDEQSRLSSQQKDDIMEKLDEDTKLDLVVSVGEDARAISSVVKDYKTLTDRAATNKQLSENDLKMFYVTIDKYLAYEFGEDEKYAIDDKMFNINLPIITAQLAGNNSTALEMDIDVYKNASKIHEYNTNTIYKKLGSEAYQYHRACVLHVLANIKIKHYVLDKVHSKNPWFFQPYLTPAAASTP